MSGKGKGFFDYLSGIVALALQVATVGYSLVLALGWTFKRGCFVALAGYVVLLWLAKFLYYRPARPPF